MAKLQNKCETCGKLLIEKSVELLPDFGIKMVTPECGHSYTLPIHEKAEWEDVETFFGRKDKLFAYQGAGYEFVRDANFRALIGDAPGLGKTAQSLVTVRLHPDILTPCLVVVKAALIYQYVSAVNRWCGPEFMPQVIKSTKDFPNPLFPIVIVTYDLLNRFSKNAIEAAEKKEKEIREELGLDEWAVIPEERQAEIPSIENPFKSFNFQCVILDECQQIKNPLSKRAQQVREICRNVPHIIATSGSPIENHAGEYFTILNILKPERFYNYKHYVENYCDFYMNSRGAYKIGGLRDLQWFRERTSDFIIRRKMEDVLPDIPKLNRKFVECGFASKKIQADYEAMEQEFSDYFYEHEGEQDFQQHILARIAKLRHKAGINKIPFAVEYVTDFINDTNKKIVIFAHHTDVQEMLNIGLTKECEAMRAIGSDIQNPILFLGEMNALQREAAKKKFMTEPSARIFIASLLAAGEGLDGLQTVCSDCILLERHFNPKKEEQAEKRIQRIGAMGDALSWINAMYILSVGTIDEWFTELVEVKRANVDQTLDGAEYAWDEQSLTMELAATIARKGNKKWKLK